MNDGSLFASGPSKPAESSATRKMERMRMVSVAVARAMRKARKRGVVVREACRGRLERIEEGDKVEEWVL